MSLPHLLYSLQHHPGSTVVMVLSTDYLHENSLIYTCNTSFCKKKKNQVTSTQKQVSIGCFQAIVLLYGYVKGHVKAS